MSRSQDSKAAAVRDAASNAELIAKSCEGTVQLVTHLAPAQQPGQLGDVRFLYPAPRMRAGPVRAGVISAAFPHLAAMADGDLPGFRDPGDRGLLPAAQFPADRVDQLIAGPGGQLVQALDEAVAGPGAIGGDHQPPPVPQRQRRNRRSACPQALSQPWQGG